MKDFVALVTAIISAFALLTGYGYQKHMEKEAEVRKTRQEIYSKLLTNITKRNEIMGRIMETPEYQKAPKPKQAYMIARNPEILKNWNDRAELASFLCLYGTDNAIKAYSVWTREQFDLYKGGNFGKLVVELRKSIYPETSANPDDANLVIWQDNNYLKQSKKAQQTFPADQH